MTGAVKASELHCRSVVALVLSCGKLCQLSHVPLVADSMKVMAVLMVVGVMDDARDDILGDGNILLSPVESLSQVCNGCDQFKTAAALPMK